VLVELYRLVLILHIIGATIWVGGHLVLSLAILPGALRSRNPVIVREFEARYERIGIPSLAVQVVTGLLLAYYWTRSLDAFLPPSSPQAWFISVKLVLLFATIVIAVHARLRVIPTLHEGNLNVLAYHAFAVTALGLALLVLGVAIRTGGLL
jgi:putative copper export protein